MKYSAFRFYQFLLFLLVPALALGQPKEQVVEGIDALITESAKKAVQILKDDKKTVTVAVYYFTADGKVSPLSDYLINGMTTEIANGVKRDKLAVSVVSRQHLDAILKELSFQLSDLADQKKQLSLGRQLGADTILVGTLAQVGETFRLNCQVLRVETGLVVGGFILGFKVEENIRKKLGLDKSGVSETVTVEDKALVEGGYATATTIYENFNGQALAIGMGHHEERSGPRKVKLSGTSTLVKDAGPDRSQCAQFAFKGSLDGTMLETDWRESDVNFYATFTTQMKSADFYGISLFVKPVGCNRIEFFISQKRGDEDVFYGVFLTLNENQWQELKIPFACLYDPDVLGRGENIPLDPARPFNISIMISYYHNFENYYLRGREVAASLFVDNLGLFKIKGSPDPAQVETWNDAVTRLPLNIELHSDVFWQDWTLLEGKSEAEAAKIDAVRKVPGIRSETVSLNRVKGPGPGNALEIVVELEVEKAFLDFLAAHPEYSLEVYIVAHPGRSWKGFKGLSFYFRSENITDCSLALEFRLDPGDEPWYHVNIAGGETWSRVRVPFGDWAGEDEDDTLAGFWEWNARPILHLDTQIPASVLEQAVSKGKIRLVLAFDDFLLEK